MNSPAIIGGAAKALAVVERLTAGPGGDRLAVLLDGDPGIGKTMVCDLVAAQLGGQFGVEHVNGQSVGVDLVREWRRDCTFGSLFAAARVKRIDELDQASPAGVAELLTFLDYLPPATYVLATTNDFARLRASAKGRLESRFVRLHVEAPSVDETARFLARRGVAASTARKIALGAVPDGCLATAGCNVRAALNDARALLAALGSSLTTATA